MRLLCGFLHLDGQPAEARRLADMIAAMIEPGLTPVVRTHVEGPVALATLDFAAAIPGPGPKAVLPRGAGGLVLAADARLYDSMDGASDETALLTALERRGGDGLGCFDGDFALAAWDPRDRSLLCARDGVGIRPLFIDDQPGRVFAVASLPRGLHASGFVAPALDETAFLSTLLVRATPDQRTVFRGVRRIAPGAWQRVSARQRNSGCHWRLDPAAAGTNRCRPEEAAEEIAALVTRAVHRRLPTTGPVASHLSGGLDSPSITVLAARAMRGTGRGLFAYSLLPTPQGAFVPEGEGPLAQLVLDQEPDIIAVPAKSGPQLEFLLPRMDCDQPMPFDPADPDSWICMDAAARGARILLSGWGGDEGASFNGRGSLAEALLAGHWWRLAREVRARAAVSGGSMAAVLRGEVLSYLLPAAVQTSVRRLFGRPLDTPNMVMSRLLRSEAMEGVTPKSPPMHPNAVANHLRLLNGPVLSRRPEYWALTGARVGIAAAFPLLDRSLVEFALSLPSALFWRDGVPRRLYRDAMAGILPDKVRQSQAKTAPFSEMALIIALQRDALLGRLPDWRRHAGVNALFDLDALERRLRALPSPEDARRRAAHLGNSPDFIKLAVLLPRALRFIAYVRQHH